MSIPCYSAPSLWTTWGCNGNWTIKWFKKKGDTLLKNFKIKQGSDTPRLVNQNDVINPYVSTRVQGVQHRWRPALVLRPPRTLESFYQRYISMTQWKSIRLIHNAFKICLQDDLMIVLCKLAHPSCTVHACKDKCPPVWKTLPSPFHHLWAPLRDQEVTGGGWGSGDKR